MERVKCVVCNKRVPLSYTTACRKCLAWTAAEGTREKYGLPKPAPSKARRNNAHVTKFNRLVGLGLKLHEIATQLDMPLQTLKNVNGELRRSGYQLASPGPYRPAKAQPQEPLDKSKLSIRANEHGGGKYGIKGCRCGPCLDRQREYRRNWQADNRAKRRVYEKDLRQRKKQQNEPP